MTSYWRLHSTCALARVCAQHSIALYSWYAYERVVYCAAQIPVKMPVPKGGKGGKAKGGAKAEGKTASVEAAKGPGNSKGAKGKK